MIAQREESPFGNEYGTLTLERREDGLDYLTIGTAMFGLSWGPLSAEHVQAFRLLCTLPEVTKD